MYFQRLITQTLGGALRQFPVVLLTGPRQCGKTELLKHELRDYRYFSLDALDTRQLAATDPRSFFVDDNPKIIIDEIQEAPELLTYIKETVDRHREPGTVILTGSSQFQLMKGVTESLAGRVAILELLPFSWPEVSPHGETKLENLVHRGMYPQLRTTVDLNFDLWFSSYINTYVQRDVRSQLAIRDLSAFETLLRLLAARVGQELNMDALSSEVGVSSVTIKAWLSVLEASYVVYLLRPYFNNFGKRLVKSPKLYFVDTGLVSYLTRTTTEDSVLSGPLAGALFENFVILELLKSYHFHGKQAPLYYWRSQDGTEIDVLIDQGSAITACEIKLTHTLTNAHLANLTKFKRLSKIPKTELVAISQSTSPAVSADIKALHWKNISDLTTQK